NGSASETCTGDYWYQTNLAGDWWGMTHGEPFLLRTFYGDVDKLTEAVKQVVAGKETIVTCLADANKEKMHEKKGKVQQMKASLKLANYDAKRDFIGFGGDIGTLPEYKTTVLMAQSTEGWKFLPAADVKDEGDKWQKPDFDDSKWRTGKAPIGYGQDEIN